MKNIALIGSCGSIGRQVLRVVKNHPDKFKIVALVANTPSEEFLKQIAEFNPVHFAVASLDREWALAAAELDCADVIFNAVGGFAGLAYSLRAVRAGKALALANKETLVCGSDIILPELSTCGGKIVPVDSEHSAIWQCLNFDCTKPVRRLIITASGGAFRGFTPEQLKDVTPEQALNHPTWKMGKKITVDSATLMNKGYEVIEAHTLYGTPYSKIDTVIQPQSIVHSMVEFEDGAILAQMSYPTMELPIQIALTYPERYACELAPMDFKKAFSLGFEPLERKSYPLFDLALRCGEAGGTLPCALNAADEVAVGAFLNKNVTYTDIFTVVDGVISATACEKVTSFEQLVEVDKKAREAAKKIIDNLNNKR